MERKSIIIEIDDAKQELIQCVNAILAKHELNCYLIEPVFAELYANIKTTAQRELAQARAAETIRQQGVEQATPKE
jgi:hypothetical protein